MKQKLSYKIKHMIANDIWVLNKSDENDGYLDLWYKDELVSEFIDPRDTVNDVYDMVKDMVDFDEIEVMDGDLDKLKSYLISEKMFGDLFN